MRIAGGAAGVNLDQIARRAGKYIDAFEEQPSPNNKIQTMQKAARLIGGAGNPHHSKKRFLWNLQKRD